MTEKESIPFAPHLIESMRSLGYSFETALADLIDNSISANSNKIELFLTPDVNPQLIILDNGCGMTNFELEEALRYGSKSPLEIRTENDLGRFGLGMKSASLSQCRKLIVVSKKNSSISCFSWDLDYIIDKQGWILLEYNEEEICKLPMIDKLKERNNGTYLLLQNFDRVASSTSNLSTTLNGFMASTIDHISLVFHRYLDNNVEIFLNNEKITSKDPFLTSHKATQQMREQYLDIENSQIKIKPYILPYINKLSQEDLQKVGGKEDLKRNQGFYIYRNKRLIIWGTWFRLTRKEELGKLARIKVDIPNTLDYMWNIDIMKSSASLPDIIKKNLYSCIDQTVFKSKGVHEYRGRKVNTDDDVNYVWERIAMRDNLYKYSINRTLPQIQLLQSSLDSKQMKIFNSLLINIENLFPTSTLYIDTAKGNIVEDREFTDEEEEKLLIELIEQVNFAENLGMDKKAMIDYLTKSEPYNKINDIDKKLNKLVGEYAYE